MKLSSYKLTLKWKNVFYHHGHTRPINLDKRHSSLAQLRLSFEAELGYSIPFKDDSNRLDLIDSTKVSWSNPLATTSLAIKLSTTFMQSQNN